MLPFVSTVGPGRGDTAIPPAKYEVPSREDRARGKYQKIWVLTLLVAFGGMLAWLPIELAVWGISGCLPYFDAGVDGTALSIGIASGAGFVALLLLTGRRNLLPLVPLPMILGIGLTGSVHYLAASGAEGSFETATFYVRSLDLRAGGEVSTRVGSAPRRT